MGLKLVTAATTTPVSLDEAKAWCKVETDADDGVFEILIAAAAGRIDDLIQSAGNGGALMSETWSATFDRFPLVIDLPRGPVTGVSSITYVDNDGATQTIDAGDYIVDLVSDPQRIVLPEGASWPEVQAVPNAVTVSFTAGFSEAPAQIKQACLLIIAHWYDNRSSDEIPAAAMKLVEPWRQGWIAA